MNLTRKEFLREGLISLGKVLVGPAATPALFESSAGDPTRPGIARADNSRCLARQAGCFSCLERCPTEALSLEPGRGVRVDAKKCSGCGACEDICPLHPKAITIAASHNR
jgi:Pyruvate/2-oxoacid:ferredoxin oxidoreductase delta subunit